VNKLIEQAREVAEKAAAEGRTLTDDERATIETALAGAKAMKADAELKSAVDALGAELADVKPETTTDKPRTIGGKMFADPAFKSWITGANAAGVPDGKSLPNSPAVAVGGLKATLLGSNDTNSAGVVINPEYLPTVGQFYARDITALNLVTMGSTDTDLVEYARVVNLGSGSVNAAAPVAEGTAAPESTLQMSKTSAPVRDVRVFIPASTRALADAGQLQTIANSFLTYGVTEELEDQIIAGDGTGENMTGILETSGTLAQSFDTDLVSTIRKAIRQVRVNGRARPSAVLLNPEDNEAVDLLSGANTDYLFGGPVGAATPTIWGLPRIESQAVPAGTAIVGDFRQAVLWERQALSVSVYPQHSDYAIRGLVAIVASARAAFGVINPAGFCIADLSA
jgi:HK97 family phage major capsid protein